MPRLRIESTQEGSESKEKDDNCMKEDRESARSISKRLRKEWEVSKPRKRWKDTSDGKIPVIEKVI